MDFLNLLKLVGGTLDVVAWPLITLVYPLYASVRAIENNSHVENRKLLIYWILCGLIMLFEFLSTSFIEWIPFWSEIKLLGTFWLVIPHFGGAVYAYDRFVRPCILANTQQFSYWMRPRQEDLRLSNSDAFLLLAERYVQEKGSEDLEKLIYGKVKCVEPNPTAENDSVSSLIKGEAEARNVIELADPGLAQTNSGATQVVKTTITGVSGVGSELSQSSVPDKGRKEWNCALCQVFTRNEDALEDHFEGKMHKAKVKELMRSTNVQTDYNEASATENKVKTVEVVNQVSELPKSSIPDKVQKEWTCALCQVCTQSEDVLNNHFQGKKHKAKEKELLAKQTATKNKNASPSKSKPNMTPKEVVPLIVAKVKTNAEKHEEKRVGGTGTRDQQAKTKQNNTKIEIPSGTHVKKPVGTGIGDQQAKTNQNNAKIEIPSGTYVIKTGENRARGTGTGDQQAKIKKDEKIELPSGAHVKKPGCIGTGDQQTKFEIPSGTYVMKTEENRVGGTGTGDQRTKTKQDTNIEIPRGTYVTKPEEKRVGGIGTGHQIARSDQNDKNALWCDSCKLQCNSLSMLTDHLQGKGHLASIGIGVGHQSSRSKQSSSKNALWCDSCKLQCNSLSMLTDHLQGKSHLASIGIGVGHQSSRSNQSSKNALWCDSCKLQCNSLSMLTDHLRGQRHLASLGM